MQPNPRHRLPVSPGPHPPRARRERRDLTDPLEGRGDTDPYSLTASYVLGARRVWEVAVRYEDLDDGLDRETLTLGLNRYLLGHDAKVLLNYRTTDSDAGDEDILGVGFSLSF